MNNQQNNKRIAKNTLLLYFRMLFMMAVSLYTSRVVLNALGVEDFGIYNVVGGVVAMFGFISGSMASSTQRFITFALGKCNEYELSKVFSSSIITHGIISLIVIAFSETIGLWLLYNKMTIPVERMDSALWVFQFSVLSTVIMIMSVPYNATIIAHEKMDVFAYISVLEVVLKLLIVYLLVVFNSDKLKLYALLLFVVQIFIRLIYGVYCKKKFKEAHFRCIYDKALLREMSLFAFWTMNGNLAVICYTQGLNILLNIFFNPAVNAARGIAVQVQGTIQNFCRNFQMALNPQITKSYAVSDYEYMHKLVYASSRYSFYLLLLLSLPIILETRFILSLWLGIVPEYTVSFIRIILVTTIVIALSNPVIVSIHATGRIKRFQTYEGTILLTILPVAYIFLKAGFPPKTVFIVHLFIEIITQTARVWIICPMINMRKRDYLRNVIYPIVKVTICATVIPVLLHLHLSVCPLNAIITIGISVPSVLLSILTTLSKKEKELIIKRLCGLKRIGT